MKALLFHVPKSILVIFVIGIVTGVAGETQAAPVDDSRVMQLEQDIRNLQRLLDQQTRRIEALESAMRQSRSNPASRSATPAQTKTQSAIAWLQNANWNKLRPGMSDTELLEILGPPTTSRKSAQGDAQTLFYAMELEAGGYLSGHVIVADHRVLEIHKPELR